MNWRADISKPLNEQGTFAVLLTQPQIPPGVNGVPFVTAPQMIAILPDDIDFLIQRLELLKSELPLKHDRGKYVLMWPEALRQLQAVLSEDEEMTNDAEHDLLVEIAEACGLESPEYCGGCGSAHTGERCDDAEDEEHEELGVTED